MLTLQVRPAEPTGAPAPPPRPQVEGGLPPSMLRALPVIIYESLRELNGGWAVLCANVGLMSQEVIIYESLRGGGWGVGGTGGLCIVGFGV